MVQPLFLAAFEFRLDTWMAERPMHLGLCVGNTKKKDHWLPECVKFTPETRRDQTTHVFVVRGRVYQLTEYFCGTLLSPTATPQKNTGTQE